MTDNCLEYLQGMQKFRHIRDDGCLLASCFFEETKLNYHLKVHSFKLAVVLLRVLSLKLSKVAI